MEVILLLRCMFLWEGRSKIDKIMGKIYILIILNDRNMLIFIYGKEFDCLLVIEKIEKYINKLVFLRLWVVDFKGEF